MPDKQLELDVHDEIQLSHSARRRYGWRYEIIAAHRGLTGREADGVKPAWFYTLRSLTSGVVLRNRYTAEQLAELGYEKRVTRRRKERGKVGAARQSSVCAGSRKIVPVGADAESDVRLTEIATLGRGALRRVRVSCPSCGRRVGVYASRGEQYRIKRHKFREPKPDRPATQA